jgi:pimeloyl-ACP methyl ester carboxylesterase
VVHTRDASVVERYIATIRTVRDSVANELTRITIPTLVIHGTADPLVPVD